MFDEHSLARVNIQYTVPKISPRSVAVVSFRRPGHCVLFNHAVMFPVDCTFDREVRKDHYMCSEV